MRSFFCTLIVDWIFICLMKSHTLVKLNVHKLMCLSICDDLVSQSYSFNDPSRWLIPVESHYSYVLLKNLCHEAVVRHFHLISKNVFVWRVLMGIRQLNLEELSLSWSALFIHLSYIILTPYVFLSVRSNCSCILKVWGDWNCLL